MKGGRRLTRFTFLETIQVTSRIDVVSKKFLAHKCCTTIVTTHSSLVFLDPPSATEKCHTIRAAVGNPVSLSCPTDGNPNPDVTWYKGSGLCGTVLSSKTELKFSEAMSNNSGWYTCFANNLLGTVSVSLYLLIGKLFFRVIRQYLTYCQDSFSLSHSLWFYRLR